MVGLDVERRGEKRGVVQAKAKQEREGGGWWVVGLGVGVERRGEQRREEEGGEVQAKAKQERTRADRWGREQGVDCCLSSGHTHRFTKQHHACRIRGVKRICLAICDALRETFDAFVGGELFPRSGNALPYDVRELRSRRQLRGSRRGGK